MNCRMQSCRHKKMQYLRIKRLKAHLLKIILFGHVQNFSLQTSKIIIKIILLGYRWSIKVVMLSLRIETNNSFAYVWEWLLSKSLPTNQTLYCQNITGVFTNWLDLWSGLWPWLAQCQVNWQYIKWHLTNDGIIIWRLDSQHFWK
jgi:hypothetical protein